MVQTRLYLRVILVKQGVVTIKQKIIEKIGTEANKNFIIFKGKKKKTENYL